MSGVSLNNTVYNFLTGCSLIVKGNSISVNV